MRCAVVDPISGAVVNVVMADPEADMPLPGTVIVAIPEGVAVDTRHAWTAEEGFKPGPELQAQIDAEAAAIEAEGFA